MDPTSRGGGRGGGWGGGVAEPRLLDRVFVLSPDLLAVIRFDGRFERVNPAMVRVFGWTAEELLATPCVELVHPEDRAASKAFSTARLGAGRVTETVENRVRCKDGSYRRLEWVLVGFAEERLVFASARDVTARAEKAREQESLSQRERSLRALIEQSPDGIAVHRAGVYVFSNEALARYLGYADASEIVGLGTLDIVHPDDRAMIGERVAAMQRTQAPNPPIEVRILRKDGTFVYTECATICVEFDGHRSILVTIRDATERRRLQSRLLIADRMASVGSLAAGIAHEMNNPLAAVIANLDMIAEEHRAVAPALPPARSRELDEMTVEAREGAERVRKIVRSLRAFAGADDEKRVALDVRDVLALSIDLAANEIRHRARLVKELGVVPTVLAAEARLAQVFVNLLVNAAQAIPEGRADENEIRVVTRTAADGRAVVEIRDTGAGIAPDVVRRIFDPFFTTKRIGGGPGLGLSVCHGLVALMGGEITVESTVGKGSLFRVVLPASAGLESPRTLAPTSPRALRHGRVLVVDDDAAIAKVLRRILRKNEIVVLPSGRAALELLDHDAGFDVVLCDLMMPEMTGMELHAALAKTMPALLERIVFMTGGAFTPAARAFLDAVPNERIEKPFDASRLRALITRLVG